MAGFGISLMVCDRHPYEIRCPRNREPLPLPGLLPGSAVSGCLPAIHKVHIPAAGPCFGLYGFPVYGNAKDTDTARTRKAFSVDYHIVNHRLLPVHAAHGPDHPVYADVPQGQAGNRNFVKCLQENPVIASVGNDVFNGYIVEYRQVTAISPIFIKHGAVDRRPVDMVHHTVRQYDILHCLHGGHWSLSGAHRSG